jgi:hypothetical protein
MRRLGYALLVALLFQGRAGAQEAAGAAEEAAENSEEGEAPGPQEKATPEAAPEATPRVTKTSRAKKAPPPTAKVGKDGLHWQRKPRKGAKLMGAVVPEERLRTAPPPRPSGNIHLYVLATHESLRVNIYNEDGSYNIEALQAASHLLRCKRTGAEKEIEPRLFDL